MYYFLSVRKTHSGQVPMQAFRTLFVCSVVIALLNTSCLTALDTITPGQYIRDGETVTVSQINEAWLRKNENWSIGI